MTEFRYCCLSFIVCTRLPVVRIHFTAVQSDTVRIQDLGNCHALVWVVESDFDYLLHDKNMLV